MIRLRICLTLLVVTAAIFGCSDDDNSITQPTKSWPLILGDVVHFDTSVPVLVAVLDPNGRKGREPFVDQEKHFGEPFLDINGNGVYDPRIDVFWFDVGGEHIDTFYIGCDSIVDTTCMGIHRLSDWDTAAGWDRTLICTLSNMDINHNGKYDSPDDPWTPGLPFEDLNGNGEFDRGQFISYQPGLPFADLNGNGVYDSETTMLLGLVKFSVESFGPNWDNYRIRPSHEEFRVYSYHSDSGVDYTFTRGIGGPLYSGWLRFEIDTAGFWFTGIDRFRLLVFEGPEIHAFSEQEFEIDERTTEIRSVSFIDSLTLNGRLHNRLICSDITRRYISPFFNWQIAARLYFAPNTLHLIACRLEPYLSDDSIWIFLDQRLDSLPMSMIR